ncbi:MAG: endopeptidase La [Candidatus Paracaedimonas acanthamoebae]|uniref:endopeptidase La n=1 Tax=Candidatus Paracaedimonas acanthamoebae TaxID=244581 RepID=A0A8J7PIY6_9PROT|nr:endopeptidase La [Candidatus Paracaedimonas acanthamoebae]
MIQIFLALYFSLFLGNLFLPQNPLSDSQGQIQSADKKNFFEAELEKIRERIKNKKLTSEAREKALAEFERLWNMNPFSPEAAEIRKYLDWLLSFPWVPENHQKEIDLAEAEKILNEDHYGLVEVKDRVIEYLAAQKRAGHKKVPVLCLLGSPGVGKTSLAKSIARALGREFQRVPLGGIRDEAEIRGHMRTYVSARPGRIIEALKKAKTTNVMILLDEIDKVGGMNWSGDPSAALLELLDPEQNNAFLDHYLEIGADLSSVMFVATANDLSNLPKAVLDRMEIVTIEGYTLQEKQEIAKRHIIPRQMEMNGLKENEFSLDRELIPLLIERYTFEAGVRGLEREIAKICRKAAKELILKGKTFISITKENLESYAGQEKVFRTRAHKVNQVGVTTGLAASGAGGNLGFIEAVIMPGSGKVFTTGSLGNMTVESFNAAASYIRAHANAFGINPEIIKQQNIHLHMPEAGSPKDGPSAGVAAAVSIVSVFTGIPVRHDVAMTGEITLHGNVLPIGGLKEKLLAAQREGIKKVLIPADNVRDLDKVPESCKAALDIIPIKKVEEAFSIALERMPTHDKLMNGMVSRR